MKSIVDLAGILLVIAGIVFTSYQGYSYTTTEKVAQIGDLKVTAEHEKVKRFPPMLGGLCLAAGVGLLVIGRFRQE